jgi:hypothetical protein
MYYGERSFPADSTAGRANLATSCPRSRFEGFNAGWKSSALFAFSIGAHVAGATFALRFPSLAGDELRGVSGAKSRRDMCAFLPSCNCFGIINRVFDLR